MEKTISVKCRVMFGQNIMLQKSAVEGVITVKADGSDSIQELKTKIAVCLALHFPLSELVVCYPARGSFHILYRVRSCCACNQ